MQENKNKNKGAEQNDFIIFGTSFYHDSLNTTINIKIKGACLK
jgi:hypothetical protein